MSDKRFVDTNVLIYAIETGGPDAAKSKRAQVLLRGDDLCISTQVLGEFYRAATNSRRKKPLGHDEAVAWVQLWKRYEVAAITPSHVDLALEIRQRYQISYYDALILAAANLAGCSTLYSEDLQHGQDYSGVTVENPFQLRTG